ncbi:hypothetical protein ACFORL_07195 [Legionella dresdenensis]|uniref:SdhA, substrate of the Dot/Icm system n=1 Tax=Legionella dresdenensis TaxID=450200 RepID=A0ABV8CEU6_9GAMM
MLGQYIEILKSFKEHQISVFLRGIRESVTTSIIDDYLTAEIKPYFNAYNYEIGVEGTMEPGPKKILFELKEGKLFYTIYRPVVEESKSKNSTPTGEHSVAEEPIPARTDTVLTDAATETDSAPESEESDNDENNQGIEPEQEEADKDVLQVEEYTLILHSETTKSEIIQIVNSCDQGVIEQEELGCTTIAPLTLIQLTPYTTDILRLIAKRGQIPDQHGPFKNFECEPKQVIQIKQFVNALYHAELTFQKLEGLELNSLSGKWQSAKKIWSEVIEQAYTASHLLANLDIDLMAIFNTEAAALTQFFKVIQEMAIEYGKSQKDQTAKDGSQLKKALEFIKRYTQKDKKASETVTASAPANAPQLANEPAPTPTNLEPAKKLEDRLKEYSHQAGTIAGITVDQMRPSSGNVDYDFLASFCGELSNYIKQATDIVDEYTGRKKQDENSQQSALSGTQANENNTAGQPRENELTAVLGAERQEELRNAALKLSVALNEIKTINFFNSYKFGNYIDIIRNTVILSTSILQQTNFLTDATQDAVRAQLAEIKYSLLPQLFEILDKIEDEALLKPGMVSEPIMHQMRSLYKLLIHYTGKFVEFDKKGIELTTIEDRKFLDLRIAKIRERIAHYTIRKHEWKVSQKALKQFVALILELDEVEKAIKSEDQVKLQHYNQKASQHSLTLEAYQKLLLQKIQEQAHHLPPALREKPIPSIENTLASEIATCDFHIKIEQNLINNIYQNAELSINPINTCAYSLDFNEEEILKKRDPEKDFCQIITTNVQINPTLKASALVVTHDELTYEQASALFSWYQGRTATLAEAEKVLAAFVGELTSLSGSLYRADNAQKKRLLEQYKIIQPYLSVLKNPEREALDQRIRDNLIHEPGQTRLPYRTQITASEVLSWINADIAPADRYSRPTINLAQTLKVARHFSQHRERLFSALKTNKYIASVTQRPLISEQSTAMTESHYAKSIKEFRQSLQNLTNALTPQMQALLATADQGIPYPELSNNAKALEQPEQVINIKRLFNALYNIEQAVDNFEALHRGLIANYSQTGYVWRLFNVYANVDNLIDLCRALYQDPHSRSLVSDLIDKALRFKNTVVDQSEAYTVDSSEVSSRAGAVQYSAIWYSLQALMLVPEHIAALNEQKPIPEEKLQQIRDRSKKTVLDIEDIIRKSDSSFLLLLKSPKMYKLFLELKAKIGEFSTTSNKAVKAHLHDIKKNLFTRILLETDRWEEQVGLQTGLLSDPMKLILDSMYQGLLEPLDLSSAIHVGLITDLTHLHKREEASNIRHSEAKREKDEIAEKTVILANLEAAINNYDKKHNISLFAPSTWFTTQNAQEQAVKQLVEAYSKALPMLVEQKNLLNGVKIETPDPKLDETIQKHIAETLPVHNIRQLATLTAAAYRGKGKTQDLKLQIAEQRQNYLQEAKGKQVDQNKKYVMDYASRFFDKRLQAITSRITDFIHVNNDYSDNLCAFLQECKNEIICDDLASSQADIKAVINQALDAKIKLFQQQNIKKYVQLENVIAALEQFNVYFRKAKSSPYENEETRAIKANCIRPLHDLAKDKSIDINARLNTIKTEVMSMRFRTALLAKKSLNRFDASWLLRCILSLLSALHLYTPRHVKLFNNLKDAVSDSPKLKPNKSRFGFFIEQERNYNAPRAPQREREQPIPAMRTVT